MFVVSSFFCLWYATSLVDGVVLVAPCVMGIRWQKGITDKGPDPKEPVTREAKEGIPGQGCAKVTKGTQAGV